MNYIFCPSYEHVYLVLHFWNAGQKDIKVITYNADVKLFCNHLGMEVVYFEYPAAVISIKNVFKGVCALYNFKKCTDRIIKDANVKRQDRFYLLGSIMCYPGFYLTQEFSKKCHLYYKDISPVDFFAVKKIKDFLNINYLRRQYLRLLIRIFLGIDLTIYYTRIGYYVLGIDDNFLKKYRVKKLDFNKSLQALRLEAMEKQKNIIKDEYDTMVTYEYESFSESLASLKSLRIMYDTLFSMLSNYAVKEHPDCIKKENVQENRYLPQKCRRFPAYIPSELLFNNVKQNVIGIVSATLISAANVEHLQAVSLLELVQWKDKVYKKHYRDFLTKQSKRIVFVRDFEELERLISRK